MAERGIKAGDVVFDARLTPHRSLPERGFVILMAAICVVSFTAGLVFFLVGAWPVIGFLGLDVVLIYVAFRVNYRRGTMYETLRLTPGSLTIDRVNHWGERRQWRFQPHWLQVLIDDPPRHDSQLVLRSHGESLAIGGFLTDEERARLTAASATEPLHEQRPVPARVPPALFHHGPFGLPAVAAALVEPARALVGVRDDDAEAGPAGLRRQALGEGEKPGPMALPAPFWIGGEHVHVPGAGRQVLQFLQGHEHGGHGVVVDRLGPVGQRVADQAPGDLAIGLHDDPVLIGKASVLAPGPAPPHVPRGLAGLGHLLP
jgi:uncharacterized membrane protein